MCLDTCCMLDWIVVCLEYLLGLVVFDIDMSIQVKIGYLF